MEGQAWILICDKAQLARCAPCHYPQYVLKEWYVNTRVNVGGDHEVREGMDTKQF